MRRYKISKNKTAGFGDMFQKIKDLFGTSNDESKKMVEKITKELKSQGFDLKKLKLVKSQGQKFIKSGDDLFYCEEIENQFENWIQEELNRFVNYWISSLNINNASSIDMSETVGNITKNYIKQQ